MSDQERTPVTPYSKNDETKPVAWTPEDANRFLTSAIHEAQRPLEDALKKRPITSGWFAGIIALLVFAAFAIALLLSSQLEKTEQRAENINRLREEILTEKVQLEAKSTLLEERLTNAANEITALQGSGEELRGAKNDLVRFRRQNELLRRQISGLEMEKTALARQLEAVKAMAIDGDLDGVDTDTDVKVADEAPGIAPFAGKGGEAAPVTGDEIDVTAEIIEEVAVEEPIISEEAVVEEAAPVAEPEAVTPESVPAPIEEIEIVDVEIPVEEPETPVAEVAEPEPAPEPEPIAEPVVVEPVTEPIPEESAEAAVEEPAPVAENFEAASEAYGEQLAGEAAPAEEAAPVEEQAEPAQEEQAPVEAAAETEATPEETPEEAPEAVVVVEEPRVEML